MTNTTPATSRRAHRPSWFGGRLQLRESTAVVTGAGRGIGRATALSLARRGAKVVLVDRNWDAVEDARNEVTQTGGAALAVMADVTFRDGWRDILERTLTHFGGAHVLVNNAGILRVGPALEASDQAWEEVLAVNLWAVIYGCRTFGAYFTQQGRGHIVNVASAAGLSGLPYSASYSTSKFGVVGLSESLRWELSDLGVGVTVVCPGVVRTGIAQNSGGPRTAELVQRYGLSAEPLGERIARAIECNQARVIYGLEPRLWNSLRWLSSGLHDRAGKAFARLRARKQLF